MKGSPILCFTFYVLFFTASNGAKVKLPHLLAILFPQLPSMSINSSPVPLPSYSQSSFPLHACLNASTIVAQPSQDTLDPLKIFVKKQWNPFECGNPAKGAEEKRDNVWSIAINDLITVDIWGTTGKLFGCSECKHKVSSCPHYVTLRNFLIGLPSLPGIEDTKKPESSSGTTKKKPKKRGLAPKDDDTAAPLVLKRLKTKLEEAQKVVKGIERDIVRVRCGAGTKLGECEMEIFGLLDRVLSTISMSTVDDFVQRMTEEVPCRGSGSSGCEGFHP